MGIDLSAARSIVETWDSSVLGLDKSDLEQMDDDERAEALRDALNRAADLLQATAAAFKADLKAQDRDLVRDAASDLIRLTRRLAPVR